MLINRFEGWYFKLQNQNQTIAFIPGSTNREVFIQVITNQKSYHYSFLELQIKKGIRIEKSVFSVGGIKVDLPDIKGVVRFGPIKPLSSDIMGPFRFFPMECRHGVISMMHSLDGEITVEGKRINFTGGKGYIEKDNGISFPKEYLWLQCNDFSAPASIMVSVAKIPFAGFHFKGCICAILFHGQEYRFATYRGVKIVHANERQVILAQGNSRLEITILDNPKGHALKSPKMGEMTGIVHENNSCHAFFRFTINEKPIFHLYSNNVSFEYVTE